jgi:hypothetical protein
MIGMTRIVQLRSESPERGPGSHSHRRKGETVSFCCAAKMLGASFWRGGARGDKPAMKSEILCPSVLQKRPDYSAP